MSKVYEYLDELVDRYPCLELCKEDIKKAFQIIFQEIS